MKGRRGIGAIIITSVLSWLSLGTPALADTYSTAVYASSPAGGGYVQSSTFSLDSVGAAADEYIASVAYTGQVDPYDGSAHGGVYWPDTGVKWGLNNGLSGVGSTTAPSGSHMRTVAAWAQSGAGLGAEYLEITSVTTTTGRVITFPPGPGPSGGSSPPSGGGGNYLPAPSNLQQTGATDTSISIAWDPVAGAVTYNVYMDGVLQMAGISGTQITLSAIPSGTHTISVAAVDSSGIEGTQTSIQASTTGASGGTGGTGGTGGSGCDCPCPPPPDWDQVAQSIGAAVASQFPTQALASAIADQIFSRIPPIPAPGSSSLGVTAPTPPAAPTHSTTVTSPPANTPTKPAEQGVMQFNLSQGQQTITVSTSESRPIQVGDPVANLPHDSVGAKPVPGQTGPSPYTPQTPSVQAPGFQGHEWTGVQGPAYQGTQWTGGGATPTPQTPSTPLPGPQPPAGGGNAPQAQTPAGPDPLYRR